MFAVSFDFNKKKWRRLKLKTELVPSTRYGHSAVFYQVELRSTISILIADYHLTLRRPLLPHGYSYKAFCAMTGLSHHLLFLTFGHSDAQPWASDAQMSKNTNDGLTRSDTGCFIAVPYGNSGRERVNPFHLWRVWNPIPWPCLSTASTAAIHCALL